MNIYPIKFKKSLSFYVIPIRFDKITQTFPLFLTPTKTPLKLQQILH